MGNRRSAATPRTYLKNNQIEGESRRNRRDRRDRRDRRQTAPSCSRFCSNVCRRLFPFNFNRCFNDCLSCKEDVVFETDHEYCDE